MIPYCYRCAGNHYGNCPRPNNPVMPPPDIIGEVNRLVGDDPICGGRVAQSTVEAIAALVARPSLEPSDADALLERVAKVCEKAFGGSSSQVWNDGFAKIVRDMKSTGRCPIAALQHGEG